MCGGASPLVIAPRLLGLGSRRAQGRPIRLVALGDSLTAGYGLPQEAAFPTVLERALKARGYKVEVANAGVSGDTSSGGLDRLDWSVPDGTDGVILELGANDMLRGLDPGRHAAGPRDHRRAAEGPRHPGAARRHVRLAQSRPRITRKNSTRIYPEIAKKHGLVLYPFFLDGVAGERCLNLPDGLHPTAKGVEIIVERILPSVESFLARLTQR